MAIDVSDVRSVLNDLIQTCKDGQQGFLDAAHHVQDHNVKSMFLELSQERSRFAGELQREVLRLQGQPAKEGKASAALHRGWVDFKAKVTGLSDSAAIHEAERGEDAAVKAYQIAQEHVLPEDIRDILERQFNDILHAHRRVRALEVRASGGAA